MPGPKLEILAWEPTALGVLCLRRRERPGRPGELVTEVTLDHELLMSSRDTASERALARRALALHPGRDLRVRVGGLGLGCTAHEVLVAGADRVARVEVVEYLPQVIGWLAQGLVPLSGALGGDPRLEVVQGDVYEQLAADPERLWDLVLIDVDHSPDEPLGSASASFYTEAGLRRAARHLAEGGVLGVWCYAEHAAFAAALRNVFDRVWIEPVTVWNELAGEEQTDWLFLARG